MVKLVNVSWEIITAYRTGTEYQPIDYNIMNQAWERIGKEAQPMHDELEKAIRARMLEQAKIMDEAITIQ